MIQYRGWAASPGIARGPAHPIRAEGLPDGLALGAILVARIVHPYMAPLFRRCGGVIVETGGLLQHVVILAREFGIPAVVGVAGAVQHFELGTLLEINGETGVVKVLD